MKFLITLWIINTFCVSAHQKFSNTFRQLKSSSSSFLPSSSASQLSSTTSRHLLESPQFIPNPIPNQVIDVTSVYDYTIDSLHVFNESIPLVISQSGPLQSWLPISNYIISGSFPLSSIHDTVVAEDIAYFAADKVYIFNVSEFLSVPILLATYTSPGIPQPGIPTRLFLQDNYLFIADDSSIQILHIGNKTSPNFISTFPFQYANVSQLVLLDNITLYATDGQMINRLDVSNISGPLSNGAFYIPTFPILQLRETDTGFLTAITANAFYTYNLSQPTMYLLHPMDISNYGGIYLVALENIFMISNDYNYDTEFYESLFITISPDPSQPPQNMGIINYTKSIYGFYTCSSLEEKYKNIMIALYTDIFFFYNVTDIAHPKIISAYNFSVQDSSVDYPRDLVWYGTNVYLIGDQGTFNASFQIIDITNITKPTSSGNHSLESTPREILYKDNCVYIATDYNGIFIFNVSDPKNIEVVSTYEQKELGSYASILIDGNLLYILEQDFWNGTEIVNITNPRTPKYLSSYPNPEYLLKFRMYNSMLWLWSDWSLQVVNFTDYKHPQLIAYYLTKFDYRTDEIKIRDNKLYTTEYSFDQRFMNIFDISKPQNLHMGYYQQNNIVDIAVGPNHIGYLTSESGLHLLNLTLPQSPTFISTYLGANKYQAIDLKYDIIYVANEKDLQFINIADPTAPISIGTLTTPDPISAVSSSTYLCLGGSQGGFRIFKLNTKIRLIGLPNLLNIGDQYLMTVNGVDKTGKVVMSDAFQLTLAEFPTLFQAIIPPTAFWANKEIRFTLPSNIFIDPNDEVLTYNVTLTDFSPLPNWLHFYGENLTFMGTAVEVTKATTWSILITAINPLGGHVSANFPLTIQPNVPPTVTNQLSTQVATVGQYFEFVLPTNTFLDPEGDHLFITAKLSDGSALPGWINFNQTIFSGKPGYLDTNFYAIRTLFIIVTASDQKYSASTSLIINVGGISAGELFVKIFAPLLSIFSFIIAVYKKRSWCLNRYKPQRYTARADIAYVGQPYVRQLETAAHVIATVQAKWDRASEFSGCSDSCYRFIKGPRMHLPGGQMLPQWLFYHAVTNSLRSWDGPKLADVDRLVVQVKDHAGVIREQWNLEVKQADQAPLLHQNHTYINSDTDQKTEIVVTNGTTHTNGGRYDDITTASSPGGTTSGGDEGDEPGIQSPTRALSPSQSDRDSVPNNYSFQIVRQNSSSKLHTTTELVPVRQPSSNEQQVQLPSPPTRQISSDPFLNPHSPRQQSPSSAHRGHKSSMAAEVIALTSLAVSSLE